MGNTGSWPCSLTNWWTHSPPWIPNSLPFIIPLLYAPNIYTLTQLFLMHTYQCPVCVLYLIIDCFLTALRTYSSILDCLLPAAGCECCALDLPLPPRSGLSCIGLPCILSAYHLWLELIVWCKVPAAYSGGMSSFVCVWCMCGCSSAVQAQCP